MRIITSAFYEINQILGYEYFDKTTIEDRSKKLLIIGLPFGEWLLEQKSGVNLQDLENEELDEEKTKRAVLGGMFYGLIIKDCEGKTFEEKYQNYLYRSGIEHCD